MKMNSFASCARAAALACALLAIPGLGAAADPPAGPIPFRNAVELALQHSGVMGIAAINQWRARKAYEEVRANYIPQITIGSGLGYSYGFPLTLEGSAPSVVNFNSDSVVFQSFAAAIHEGGKDRLARDFARCAGQTRRRHSGYGPDLRAARPAHGQDQGTRRSSERLPRKRSSSASSDCRKAWTANSRSPAANW